MQTRLPLPLVEHIARLASIDLEADELPLLAQELQSIVDYMQVLHEAVDGTDEEPVVIARPATREDDIAPSLPQRQAVDQSPCVAQHAFAVPTLFRDR